MITLTFLQEIGFRDAASFGEEAAALGDLAKVGVPVAPAFVLPTSACAEFLSSKLARQVLSKGIGPDLRRELWGLPIPSRLAREIEEFYRRLSGPRDIFVAVRSGGRAERADGVADLLSAIKKLWVEHLVAVAARGGDLYQEATPVLVQQEMVADFSGRLFTSSPELASADLCLVEVDYPQGKERFVLEKSTGSVVRRLVSGLAEGEADPQSLSELSVWAAKVEKILGGAYQLNWKVWRGQFAFEGITRVFLPRSQAFALPLWIEVSGEVGEVKDIGGVVVRDAKLAVELAGRFPHKPILFFLEPFNFNQLDAFREGKRKIGLKNLHLILPPVRTVDGMRELKRYLSGERIQRGPNLKFFFQAAYPSNIILMEQFLKIGVDGVILNEDELSRSLLGTAERVEPDESLLWALKESSRQCQLEGVDILYRAGQLRDWVLAEAARVGMGGIIVPQHQYPQYSKILQEVEGERLA
ncbi:hypothetical protein A3J33_01705 [candidate division WWE3 bacterium RIFCSPLOWO2_02_FULL_53_10]|uniref:Uncharacterized protein n=1 Tax=candidate division WWE3 bacterium RIFCSPLOWO2_02_FULL_53_10 TaxID=1802629 RepID=A0A1F4W491_UNCKA|nr:MAG: hypothetical protein A3J33_01705 [candidate division WWE3 bacterium RIFCSPLOWO2_02_FULL_53_10]